MTELETLRAQLAEANAQKAKDAAVIAALKASQSTRGISLKVSEKGCVSIYGMNSRGIHLYPSQMLKVFDNQDKIKAFISANRDLLSWKNDADKIAAE